MRPPRDERIDEFPRPPSTPPRRPATLFLLLGAFVAAVSLLATDSAPPSFEEILGLWVNEWAILLLLGTVAALASTQIPDPRRRIPIEFAGKAVVGVCFLVIASASFAIYPWSDVQFSFTMLLAIGLGFLARAGELVLLWRHGKRANVKKE
jgi:hypothetical protein